MPEQRSAVEKQVKRPAKKDVSVTPQGKLGGMTPRPEEIVTVYEATLPGQVRQLNDYRLQPVQRQALMTRIGWVQGNRHLQRLVALIQRREPEEVTPAQSNTDPASPTPATRQNVTETYRDESGSLTELAAAFTTRRAAETNTPLSYKGYEWNQQPDGSYRTEVEWILPQITMTLPRWQEYGAASAAAQGEWDRFVGQTRIHEQEAHVDKARDLLNQLQEADRVVVAGSPEELKAKIEAKAKELAQRLQAIHAQCDHGVSIGAVLNPANAQMTGAP
jgi:hypothetical protein